MTAPDTGPTPDPTPEMTEERIYQCLQEYSALVLDRLIGCKTIYVGVVRGVVIDGEMAAARGDLEAEEKLRNFRELLSKTLMLAAAWRRCKDGVPWSPQP